MLFILSSFFNMNDLSWLWKHSKWWVASKRNTYACFSIRILMVLYLFPRENTSSTELCLFVFSFAQTEEYLHWVKRDKVCNGWSTGIDDSHLSSKFWHTQYQAGKTSVKYANVFDVILFYWCWLFTAERVFSSVFHQCAHSKWIRCGL